MSHRDHRDHQDDEGLRKERLERRRRRASSEQQMGMAITIGGIVLVLAILFIVYLMTRQPPLPPPEVRRAQEKAESERLEKLLPDPVPTVLRRKKTEEELEEEKRKRLYGKGVSGDALREQMDKEYRAALRRAGIYKQKGQWGLAVKELEALADRYDDDEVRLRLQPELDQMLEQSADAFKEAKRSAEQLAGNHDYTAARQVLIDYAGKCEVPAHAEECRELADKYMGQRAAYLETQYRTAHQEIDALLPEWKLVEAAEKAEAMKFTEPEYQEKHRQRVAELRALVDLQARMIRKINGAMPRISKRAIRAPGMAGEMTDASVEGFKAEAGGRVEEYTWHQIGPEAVMRLALLCGDQKDPQHRQGIARLLMEVGELKRARMQLDAAKELGGDVAAAEERLRTKEAAAGQGGT